MPAVCLTFATASCRASAMRRARSGPFRAKLRSRPCSYPLRTRTPFRGRFRRSYPQPSRIGLARRVGYEVQIVATRFDARPGLEQRRLAGPTCR